MAQLNMRLMEWLHRWPIYSSDCDGSFENILVTDYKRDRGVRLWETWEEGKNRIGYGRFTQPSPSFLDSNQPIPSLLLAFFCNVISFPIHVQYA